MANNIATNEPCPSGRLSIRMAHRGHTRGVRQVAGQDGPVVCATQSGAFRRIMCLFATALWIGRGSAALSQDISVDTSRYSPACGVAVRAEANRVNVSWPMPDG